MTNVLKCGIVLVLAIGGLLFFFFLRFSHPIAHDELYWFTAGSTYFNTGTPLAYPKLDSVAAASPHMYVLSVVVSFHVFGESIESARLPGVVFGVVTVLLVFFYSKHLGCVNKANRAVWACAGALLCACTPAVVQGAAIIDIDNSYLPAAILFLCGASVLALEQPSARRIFFVVLAMTLALWGRTTTPTFVAAVVAVAALLVRSCTFKAKMLLWIGLGLGYVVFLATWGVYCAACGTPVWEPFRYSVATFSQRVAAQESFTLSGIARDVLFLALWSGILAVPLFIIAVLSRAKAWLAARSLEPRDLFLVAGFALLLCCSFGGGTLFGFPKYVVPALPLLIVGTVAFLSRTELDGPQRNHRLLAGFALAATMFAVTFVAGFDPLLFFRLSLREAIAFDKPLDPLIWDQGARAVTLLLGLVVLLLSPLFIEPLKNTRFFALWSLSLGICLGMLTIQAVRGYHTGYNYGEQGRSDIVALLSEKADGRGIVLAPDEVLFYLKRSCLRSMPNKLWTDKQKLLSLLHSDNAVGLAYGASTNTIEQIRLLRTDKDIVGILSRKYELRKVGTYWLWLRRSEEAR